ncbi:hypothetical protein YWIDRAFT_07092 [Streptomyces sp. SceaMP-e96]|nr:hypothetical protein YWIDRAFT_07092 [Streptomyces sp. SceaMP-e96]
MRLRPHAMSLAEGLAMDGAPFTRGTGPVCASGKPDGDVASSCWEDSEVLDAM